LSSFLPTPTRPPPRSTLFPYTTLFRSGRGLLDRLIRKAAVDGVVARPPGALIARMHNQVVVQRPQSRIGDALVELLVIRLGEVHRDQVYAGLLARRHLLGLALLGRPRPADPRTVIVLQHWLERRDEPARGGHPLIADPVDGQTVGDNKKIRTTVGGHRAS